MACLHCNGDGWRNVSGVETRQCDNCRGTGKACRVKGCACKAAARRAKAAARSTQTTIVERREARARHWRKSGVSDSTVRWMRDNGML